MTVEQILIEIKKIAEECLSANSKLYLFGSQATGKAHSTSDIDIAVSATTSEEFNQFNDLVEQIPTLRKIDIVNLNKISDSFQEDILKHGKLL